MTSMKTGLTIAGSDCSGGAGIQADIRAYIINYLRGFYPDWTEEKGRYHKWDSVSESSST